ncbi:MAG: hypothetical protein M1305_02580, partial [Candidatus Marsarchaeota archaeon]|nr:hypothetical protein [Candidatus Marsarchaeota archaeon]
MTGKYVQPREVNRAVFGLIYRCRYACREQITLAIRGRRRANDRYIHRCLRKMETLGILSAHRQSLLSKKIYCLARRNAEGRRLALAVFGEDRRAVSGRLDAQIDHSLFLT